MAAEVPATGQTLHHDQVASRFELRVDGALASLADYRSEGATWVFTHTETLPRFGGRGLAGRLVRHALDEARAGGHPVVPECWFVAAYIRDHPDDVELLPAELRRRFAPH